SSPLRDGASSPHCSSQASFRSRKPDGRCADQATLDRARIGGPRGGSRILGRPKKEGSVPEPSDRGNTGQSSSRVELATPSLFRLQGHSGTVPRIGVVLAAGRSERLRAVTGGGSKALVQLGGLKLVERAVRGLLDTGIGDVLVVVGYHAGPVGAVVSRLSPGRVHAVLATEWELGNGA